VILGKLIAVSAASFLTGYSVPTSIRAGMSLAQIGEFSFIIAGVGLAAGAIRPFLYPIAIAVSAVTTLTTPWLIRISQSVANQVDRNLPQRLQTFVSLYGSWIERMRAPRGAQRGAARLALMLFIDGLLLALLIIGIALELPRLSSMLGNAFGLTPAVARGIVLGAEVVLAAPLVIGVVRTSKLLATMLALRAMPEVKTGEIDYSAAPRRALATTLQLALVALTGIVLVAITQPFLPAYRGVALLIAVTSVFAIAFWRNAANLHGHARAGAEILGHALGRQLPNEREPQTAPSEQSGDESLDRLMRGFGEPIAWRITSASPALERTLAELNLRGSTGATVLAIHREDGEVVLPNGKERLHEGDVLVLAGTHAALESARELLNRPRD
jgi:CPA2 family monovalent cation:H+ antiporter-2